MLPELILKEPLVRFFDVLREVAEESKCRESRWKLGYVLNLYVLTLPCRRRPW